MKIQLHIVIAFISLLVYHNSAAQLVNDGAKIAISPNALLYVSDDFTQKNGEILHNGELIIGGNWINQSANTPVFANASSGIVKFIGSTANFSGIGTTVFPKLVFSGTGVFKMQTNIGAALDLNLGDAELQTNNSELTLFNTDPNSMQFNNGFVSTGNNGLFVRYLKDNSDYVYPLGSSKLGLKRFVSIKPKQIAQQAIGAAFVDTDPNVAGYDRSQKSNTVAEINKDFYHVLKRINGITAVDVNFHTTSSETFTNLINWTMKNIWDRAHPTTFGDYVAVIPTLNKAFLHSSANLPLAVAVPYAFANVTSVSPLVIYNAFSPDGDGKNDTWEIKNIDAYPDNELKIFDRSGNLVFRNIGYDSAKFWDGKNVSSGTYIYILRVKIDGKNEYFKGAITMVKN